MKVLLTLIISSSLAAAAEPLILKLNYKEGENNNFGAQIQTAFTKLLTSDPTLSQEYAKFEAPPSEEAQGRYSGAPTILPIQISEEEFSVTFREGSKTEFKETIALYYRFDEGRHRGGQTRSGFFALFTVAGELSLGEESHELLMSNVAATFQGFSRNLVAPKPNEDDQADQIDTEQPTIRLESKLEGSNKPQHEAEGVSDLVKSFSKSPDERFSIGLDGILGAASQAHPEFDVHLARLYDRKARKFVGRKVPLSTEGCHIDFTNKKIGNDGWKAFWHPMSKFVVLAVPVTASENEGPHLEYFYFQVTDSGILPMSPPNVAAHVFRSFQDDEEISIGHIEPKGWIEKNHLRVNITGNHFDGGEAPDFSRNGVLKFDDDGNVTVDSIEKDQPNSDPQDDQNQ